MNFALEHHWVEVRGLVHSIVKRYAASYPLDEDEASSLAALAFIDAYNTYREEFGSLKQWVVRKTHYAMMTMIRRQTHERKLGELPAEIPSRTPSFLLKDFLEGLSRDARLVVLLSIFQPLVIELEMAICGKATTHNLRRAIKATLRDLRWTWTRIRQTFREVKDALQ